MQPSPTQFKFFPKAESPTNRFPLLPDGSVRGGPSSSGLRNRVATPNDEELARMEAYAASYDELRRKSEGAIDLSRVLVVTGRLPEAVVLDDDAIGLMRLVNGVSSVEDVLDSAVIERSRAIAVLCRLILSRAITFT